VIGGKWWKSSYQVLEKAHITSEQIDGAIKMIKLIAESLDKQIILRISRCNFESMAQLLRGLLLSMFV
jgi:hypothetical protein